MLKSTKPIAFFILVVALLSVLLLNYSIYEEKKYFNKDNILKKIEFIGTYNPDECKDSIQLSEDFNLDTRKVKRIVLTGSFNMDVEKNESILFRCINLRIKIYKNNREIFSYGEEGSYPYLSKSPGNGWVVFVAPEDILQDDIINIELTNIYSNNYSIAYKYFISRMYKGDSTLLLSKLLSEKSVKIFIALIIIMMGIVLLFSLIIMYILKFTIGKAPFHLSLFMITGGAWLLIDFNLISFVIPYGIFVQILYRILQFMLLPLIFLYILNFIDGKTKKIVLITEYVMLGFTFFYLIAKMLGLYDAYEILTIFVILMLATFLINLVSLIYQIKKNRRKDIKFLLCSIVIMGFFSLWDVINYFINVFEYNIGFTVGFIIFVVMNFYYTVMYIKKKFNKAQRVHEMEKELIQSRISVMISQIQPHFLYNSLIAIQQLIDEDPEKAEEAIGNFAFFLRGNLDSLSAVEPIEFYKELNHTKTYLSLEQMRFGKRLKVEYDIKISDFMIPSLTIQPLVENAVRYGISKKPQGGKVTIKTIENDHEIIIVIKDDGVGFDINKKIESGRSHIGIKNVNNRLSAQCNGSLKVESVKDVGTIAVIRIPKEE